MDVLMDAQSKLVPEMMELMQQRYRILKLVKMAGPIGRRPLGQMAGLSERETRTMMDTLRGQNLITIAKDGASITTEGLNVLLALESSMEDWSGRTSIAKRLMEFLGIQSVKVVAGNCDTDTASKSLLGMEAAKQFSSKIDEGKVVAVTGGSTIASIPLHIEKFSGTNNLLFIAARGGVGDDIGLQANVIAASFASACGGTYSTFYYPESLSEEAHEAFRKEPSVLKMLELYDTTDCVLHGVGDAQTMAIMRNSPTEERDMIQDNGAKGEAFGYYFDQDGNVVHRLRTIGIQTGHLEKIRLIISVAGGSSKAEAILAYMASAPKQTILVTDEGAATEMLKILVNK
ncbi:sugar-binding transcriptional regulator [Sporosarcina psychrophila]|uniref:sugar-binding transcriptional regulator n=1 Tax=Sporosarcina psychrophila TaxID=1476 RepID=UPI003B9EFBB8